MVQDISAHQLKQWQQENKPFFLLDVREAHERNTANMGGTWIPMAEVLRHHDQLPFDQPVVVYCRKGVRSAIVIQRLQDKFGLSNLFNLQGGLVAWQAYENKTPPMPGG